MNLSSRLDAVERSLGRNRPRDLRKADPAALTFGELHCLVNLLRGDFGLPQLPQDHEEADLIQWGEFAATGFFDHEPDFPEAFAGYRQSIETARGRTKPAPWLPPPAFLPCLAGDDSLRISNWRSLKANGFGTVLEYSAWVDSIYWRASHKEPPLTGPQFDELATWFRENESALSSGSRNGFIPFGEVKQTTAANIRFDLRSGHKTRRGSDGAQIIRQVQAFHSWGNPKNHKRTKEDSHL